MNVQEIIYKVKANLDTRSDPGGLELPKEDPLRRNYEIEGERNLYSEYVEQDEGYASINREDILLQDLFSNLPDEEVTSITGSARISFREVDERVKQDGIDALAWYVPFHYESGNHPWGIYLLDKGIWTVANALDPLRKNNFVTNDLIVFGVNLT